MKVRHFVRSLTVLFVLLFGAGIASGMTTDTLIVTGFISQTNSSTTNTFMGNTGIGTSTPSAKLEVSGAGGYSVDLKVNGRILSSDNTSGGMWCGSGLTMFMGIAQSSEIGLYNMNWRLVADGSGHVGIGTLSPSQTLDVCGNGLIETNLTVKGSLSVGSGATYANLAVAEGQATAASGTCSHAEGDYTVASGYASHAEGDYSAASAEATHAEGFTTVASTRFAHAEGYRSQAIGDFSAHAEGYFSWASGNYGSHAEGGYTEANGVNSHAEGYNTVAGGWSSHAAGLNACANNDNAYVWSDGTTFASTTNKQFSVFATNGIRLLGGPTIVMPAGDISMGTFTNMPPQ